MGRCEASVDLAPGHGRSHPGADGRRLVEVLVLILAFMAAEVVVGVLAHSLALLSDAGHMLTDAGAIGLSLLALRLAARPPAGGLTFGLKRAEVLSALANGVALLVLAVVIAFEAARRLSSPPTVGGQQMLIVALAGIGVNLVATWGLVRAERRSLNLRGSLQHLLTDLYAFVGTAVAGIVILTTGFQRADAIASLLVAVLMVRGSYRLLRDAGRVLLEAAPADLDAAQVAEEMRRQPGVADVHDFHLWEITSGMPSLSAHVLVGPGGDCHQVRRELERLLRERFSIDHTTLQMDHQPFVALDRIFWPGPVPGRRQGLPHLPAASR
jgi:cobalt-zinc-cadmium efflux system protein